MAEISHYLMQGTNENFLIEAVYASLPTNSVFPEILPQFDGNLAAAFAQSFSDTGLNPATTPVGSNLLPSFIC